MPPANPVAGTREWRRGIAKHLDLMARLVTTGRAIPFAKFAFTDCGLCGFRRRRNFAP